ncbi:MAG: hypothetical protein U9P14_12890 [Gemmatimonadota bacterium]|nr:hypothetical protein [Gemmatimonadota bacterium]
MQKTREPANRRLWVTGLFLITAIFLNDSVLAEKKSGFSTSPEIDIWYGENQRFGHLGIPQPLINILGNVSDRDGIAELAWSLNGSAPRSLSLGCNLHRLAMPGDFNVEIDQRELRNGINKIELAAVDSAGNTSDKTVSVDFTRGRTWPLPYSINWSEVKNIQDVAQVVDGRWLLDSNGVRSIEPYYDRVIAIGDTSWTDYEAVVRVTYNRYPQLLEKGGPPYRRSAHGSVCLRWRGHDNDGRQPLRKWWPLGGLAALSTWAGQPDWRWDLWKGDEVRKPIKEKSGRGIQVNRPYIYKIRVETLTGPQSRYSMKVWDASRNEPIDWDMVIIEDERDLQSGSMLFVVHHADVTFGNLNIIPITH